MDVGELQRRNGRGMGVRAWNAADSECSINIQNIPKSLSGRWNARDKACG